MSTLADARQPPAAPLAPSHGATAMLLHWGAAAVLVAAFVLGLTLDEFPRGASRDTAKMVHYSLGMLVFGLVMIRLLRRLLVPPPPVEGGAMLRLAAAAMHWALYAAMVALPLTGAFDRWARGRKLVVFGDITIPPPFAIGGGKVWEEAHEVIAYALLALVIAHVAAALWHHLVLKDGTLRRMLPFAKA